MVLSKDVLPASYDIHNMSLHELANMTQRMAANGENNAQINCCFRWLIEKNFLTLK